MYIAVQKMGVTSWNLAETEGFEPSSRKPANAFRVRPVMTTSIRLHVVRVLFDYKSRVDLRQGWIISLWVTENVTSEVLLETKRGIFHKSLCKCLSRNVLRRQKQRFPILVTKTLTSEPLLVRRLVIFEKKTGKRRHYSPKPSPQKPFRWGKRWFKMREQASIRPLFSRFRQLYIFCV